MILLIEQQIVLRLISLLGGLLFADCELYLFFFGCFSFGHIAKSCNLQFNMYYSVLWCRVLRITMQLRRYDNCFESTTHVLYVYVRHSTTHSTVTKFSRRRFVQCSYVTIIRISHQRFRSLFFNVKTELYFKIIKSPVLWKPSKK